MAVTQQIKQLVSQVVISKGICLPKLCLTTTYRYSQYPPNFIEPVFRKEDLAKLKETGEIKKMAHVPIKAAKTEHTSSDMYDPVLELFINFVMRKGEKELARRLMNQAFEEVKRVQVKKYNKQTDPEEKERIIIDPLKVFHKAVENCKPVLMLTSVKRGGAVYQVPVPVSPRKATFLSMNWLIDQGKAEPKDVRFYVKLANELIHASQGQGKVIKRKEDLHRQCEANRAYAHYRWQ